MYSHTCSKSMDQPGKTANPARGQLDKENEYLPIRVRAPDNLVSRDGLGSPVPRQAAHFHTQAEFGAYLLRDSSRVPRRAWAPPQAVFSFFARGDWANKGWERLLTIKAVGGS